MENSKLDNIIDDDRQFERLLMQAMSKQGREKDKEIISSLRDTTEEQLRESLADPTSTQAVKSKFVWYKSVVFRAAAACIIFAVCFFGLSRIDFGRRDQNQYASLFNTYYSDHAVNLQLFQSGGDNYNVAGGKSTAKILEEASRDLKSNSNRKVARGIAKLENLLTLNYKKSLASEIHWYLGLGYLKQGRVELSRKELETVVAFGKAHADEAKSLLENKAMR